MNPPLRHRIFQPEAMSSTGRGGIGTTLTGGIQHIAAILPLLGTERCAVHVSSALTRGYLYAAAAPMSIFGSLGLVIAGFKTLLACFSFGDVEGAKILGNVGFKPQGENLSLIMVEPGKGINAGRYIIETRMDELITELNIDKNRITGVSHKSVAWNLRMIATTAILSAFSITPYIYLNQGMNSLDESTTWLFPVVRATGGFITTTLIQLLIQRRITTLSDHYLVNRCQLSKTDVEGAVEKKKHQMDACTWLMQCLLLIGLVTSVVGYIGCFSVVQNSTSEIGPIRWLCVEIVLSLMRFTIWAYNPKRDNSPPLEIILELDKYEHNPFPTCNKDNEDILQYKVLPLTRARDFLKLITSFAGIIEPFNIPNLSLYYTLTWKRPSKESAPAEKHQLGEWTLYITVFDHKEHTTRVYTRENGIETFYSTNSDAPLIDLGYSLLEVKLDIKMDPKIDPVSSDRNVLDSLRNHYRSIVEQLEHRLGAGHRDVTKLYAIGNNWTMKVEDTAGIISTLQKLRDDKNGETVFENRKGEQQNEETLLISDYYLIHSSVEREQRLLDEERRVKWIAGRMETIIEETKESKMGVEYRVN